MYVGGLAGSRHGEGGGWPALHPGPCITVFLLGGLLWGFDNLLHVACHDSHEAWGARWGSGEVVTLCPWTSTSFLSVICNPICHSAWPSTARGKREGEANWGLPSSEAAFHHPVFSSSHTLLDETDHLAQEPLRISPIASLLSLLLVYNSEFLVPAKSICFIHFFPASKILFVFSLFHCLGPNCLCFC